jgi:hypothetical protein
MKRLSIYLLLVFSMAVVAQQVVEQAEEPDPVAEQTGEAVPDDGSDPPEAGDEGDAPGIPGELADETESGSTSQAEDEQAVEPPDAEDSEEGEDPGPDEGEFTPEEEISEDYPVPLPSDI